MADGARQIRQEIAEIKTIADVIERLAATNLTPLHDCQHAMAVAEQSGEPFDQALCKLGFIEESTLARFFSNEFAIPLLDTTTTPLDPSVLGDVNLTYCEFNRVLPFCKNGDSITALTVDPLNTRALQGLAFSLGKPVTPVLVTANDFDRIFETVQLETSNHLKSDQDTDFSDDIDRLKDMASTEPIIKHVNRLILDASSMRASDIHLEPSERHYNVRFRIDGVLHQMSTIEPSKALSTVSRLKILSNLDIAERRRPQDGRFAFPVAGRKIDLRVSSTPTVDGESMVIRLLDKSSAPLDLEALGFNEKHRRQLSSFIHRPNGIVLITGPTGSGKTTTLYTLLSMLADGERKILTIEDPVEYHLAGANQTQVNTQIGLTFAAGLRAFLRHDPDVIMVGEMRDFETASIAVQAAMTGHLVLSTLHTNDAPSAITRLIDMGIEDYLISSTIIGVAAQRLVPKFCSVCSDYDTEDKRNCNMCHGAGHIGRVAVAEVLEVDSVLQSAIKKGASSTDIAQAAAKQNFQTIHADGAEKASAGLIRLEDVRRVTGIQND